MINWDRVTELRDEIGGEDFAEVVTLFLEEADEVALHLPDCADAKPLESALHFLKGSALNLGFSDLAALCQEGERIAASGSTDFDVSRVVACYDTSKSAFESGLDRLCNQAA